MSYNVYCTADFGEAHTGLTVHGKLLDMTGALVGSAITSGIVESAEVDGEYFYTLSVPDGHAGSFVMYDSANTKLRRTIGIAPRETENADVKTSSRLAGADYTAPPTASQIDTQLSGTHGAGSWSTATGFATPTNVTDTQTAITSAISALNNLSQAQAQSAANAALVAYDPPTKAELDAAVASLNNLSGSDILALSVETGHSLQVVLRALYALVRGKSVADSADNPTEILYYAPDNTTVRVTHTLTDTTRTVA